jgi:hypothetical protein
MVSSQKRRDRRHQAPVLHFQSATLLRENSETCGVLPMIHFQPTALPRENGKTTQFHAAGASRSTYFTTRSNDRYQ